MLGSRMIDLIPDLTHLHNRMTGRLSGMFHSFSPDSWRLLTGRNNSETSMQASCSEDEEQSDLVLNIPTLYCAVRPGGHRPQYKEAVQSQELPECQDEVFVARLSSCPGKQENDIVLAAVFDGHGTHGGAAARLAANFLFDSVADRADVRSLLSSPTLCRNDLEHAAEALCCELQEKLCEHIPSAELSGTTACFALVHEPTKRLFVANVGDSRAVLARKRADGDVDLLWASTPHKPEHRTEMDRIQRSGGRVQQERSHIDGSAYGPYRVFRREGARTIPVPGLAMSRSLGDLQAHAVGVNSLPSSFYHVVEDSDAFLVLATDGVWDVMEPEEVVDFVHYFSRKPSGGLSPAQALTLEALSRWKGRPRMPSKIDDIAAVIIPLPAFAENPEPEDGVVSFKVITDSCASCNAEANTPEVLKQARTLLMLPPNIDFCHFHQEGRGEAVPPPQGLKTVGLSDFTKGCLNRARSVPAPFPGAKQGRSKVGMSKSRSCAPSAADVYQEVIPEDAPADLITDIGLGNHWLLRKIPPIITVIPKAEQERRQRLLQAQAMESESPAEPPASEFARVRFAETPSGDDCRSSSEFSDSEVLTPMQILEARAATGDSQSSDGTNWEGCVRNGRPHTSPGLASTGSSESTLKSTSSCPEFQPEAPPAAPRGVPESAGGTKVPPRYPEVASRSSDDLLVGSLCSACSLDDPSTEHRVHGAPSALLHVYSGLVKSQSGRVCSWDDPSTENRVHGSPSALFYLNSGASSMSFDGACLLED
eukprot:jgi/Botrbrau1/8455/Bobra.0237s0072.1